MRLLIPEMWQGAGLQSISDAYILSGYQHMLLILLVCEATAGIRIQVMMGRGRREMEDGGQSITTFLATRLLVGNCFQLALRVG